MKKFLLLCAALLLGATAHAQSSATVEIQFYVDANSNCVYNIGEQLVYVPYTMTYVASNSSLQTAWGGGSVMACGPSTLYVWTPSATATNTLGLAISGGVIPNLTCGNYTNIPYNTNTTQYLPVILTGTNNIGIFASLINYYSSLGAYTYTNLSMTNNTIGICSNLGNDSIRMYFNVYNLLTCNNTGSMSPRTYSLYMDGVMYDQLTTTGPFSSVTFTTGQNAMSDMTEYYYANQTYLYLYPQLPATFSVLGTHTFAVKSSMIYNNTASAMNFSCLINSIPCTKISGRFYNDCNSNCTFDVNDNYVVGYMATGKVYNATTGFNMNFYPNPADGKFSLYLPTSTAYSLTQYPTYTVSPLNFTACTTGTVTIPASASTNTFMFGYKKQTIGLTDPSIYLTRSASTSNSVLPSTGVVFSLIQWNYWWNTCATNTLNPGKMKVTLPKFINYVSMVSGPVPTVVTGSTMDTLIWSIANFSNMPGGFGSFSAAINATAVPGTCFTITAKIFPTSDINFNNNTWNFPRCVGGPYDPNEKVTEVAGLQSNGNVPFGTQQFYYTIGFQNIGTGPAINVKTVDTMDVNFDLRTLEVLQSSFPVNTQVDHVSRTVVFHFEGINLPASMTDEPKSHGYVRYGIKLKPGVPVNTVLKNRAHNYFDFNEGVATNQTVNKLVVITSIENYGRTEHIVKAMPNPFDSRLKLASDRKIERVAVYSLTGSLVMEMHADAEEVNLDLDALAPAMYIIQVTSDEQAVSTIKVIKN